MRSKNALKLAFLREKRRINPIPKIPKSGDFASFMNGQFPDKFAKTNDGSDFLILQSWIDEIETEAMLVFLSDTGAQILKKHHVWLLDGTFRSAPSPFSQVYIIMARSEHGGHNLPCGFSLLPDKKASTYNLMLNKILEKVGDDRVLSIVVCDFEQAMWKTLGELVPNVDQRGCQFHFRKAVYTKLGEFGLQSFYNGNLEFNELVHKVYALSYVPIDDVVQVYEEHIISFIEKKIVPKTGDKTWIDVTDELGEFLTYLDRTWIGKPFPTRTGRQAKRRPPLFPHDMWNVYNCMLEEDPVTTNNGLESWNRTFNSSMGTNPNMWKVIQGFIDAESETKRVLVANAAGRDLNANTGRKSLVKDHYERIASIAHQYTTLPGNEYINLIAHDLSMN